MKIIDRIILLICIYILCRIVYPKKKNKKKENETPEDKPKTVHSVMGKSKFVLPDRSKPLQTPTTNSESEKGKEKESIFAPQSEEKRPVAIPDNELDNVFDDGSNSEMMSIPLESEADEEDNIDFEAEEAEEIHQLLGHEPAFADGMDYDDLQTVVKVVKEQPDEVSEETSEILAELENTDMFEMLVSGDDGKANWIKSIVDRSIRNRIPETKNEISNTEDYDDFLNDFVG